MMDIQNEYVQEKPDFDLSDYMRYFVSIRNTIQTKEILELSERIKEWIDRGSCGSIIYGEPRVGKTRAMLYICDLLRMKYGSELPVYIYNCTDHSHNVTDKNIYTEILKAIGAPGPKSRETAQNLKRRILSIMQVAACDTKYRDVILFIDEAQYLQDRDYNWLMDLYNNLNLVDVQLIVFLIGQPELLAIKKACIRERKKQIVGRI